MSFANLFEQRLKKASPQVWMNWQKDLLSDVKVEKEKEFFQYVQKIDWNLSEPNLIGPKDLQKAAHPSFSTLGKLTPVAQWAASFAHSAWTLDINSSMNEVVFTEPTGPGFQLASAFLDLSIGANKKAKVFLKFAPSEMQSTESILALLTQVNVAEDAELELFIVQEQNTKNSHIFNLKADLAENAQLKIYHINGGAAWSECSYHFVQDGERSFSDLKVLQLGTNGQKHRIWANSYMNGSYTKTSQLVKTLLNGQAKNHFIGRIKIAKGITEVDAFQKNQNLLLSRQAQALNQPELEVLSDNVKAAHGSATGFMSEDELFYLQSRGLTEFEGRTFLAEGFANSIISDLDEALKTKAGQSISARIHNVCT